MEGAVDAGAALGAGAVGHAHVLGDAERVAVLGEVVVVRVDPVPDLPHPGAPVEAEVLGELADGLADPLGPLVGLGDLVELDEVGEDHVGPPERAVLGRLERALREDEVLAAPHRLLDGLEHRLDLGQLLLRRDALLRRALGLAVQADDLVAGDVERHLEPLVLRVGLDQELLALLEALAEVGDDVLVGGVAGGRVLDVLQLVLEPLALRPGLREPLAQLGVLGLGGLELAPQLLRLGDPLLGAALVPGGLVLGLLRLPDGRLELLLGPDGAALEEDHGLAADRQEALVDLGDLHLLLDVGAQQPDVLLQVELGQLVGAGLDAELRLEALHGQDGVVLVL